MAAERLGPPGQGTSSQRGAGRRIRVLVADDHGVVRTGLRTFLGAHPDIEVVGEAGTARDAVSLAERLRPDVVLMDLVMPESPEPSAPGSGPSGKAHGVEAIRALRERVPGTRCLALTSFSDEERVLPALEAGAAGYLLKDVTPDELVRAIREVAAGQVYLSSGVAGTVVRRATRPARAAASPLDALTPREREVLRCLAEGLGNAAIARRLYVTEATVKSHVTRIFRKLGVRDRTRAALVAVRLGL